MVLVERPRPVRFLVGDRDTKFTSSFDEFLNAEGARIIRTPVRAPQAEAFAEPFVGTVRRECLDRMLILGRRHLEVVLVEYLAHYNQHRPHRALAQQARSRWTSHRRRMIPSLRNYDAMTPSLVSFTSTDWSHDLLGWDFRRPHPPETSEGAAKPSDTAGDRSRATATATTSVGATIRGYGDARVSSRRTRQPGCRCSISWWLPRVCHINSWRGVPTAQGSVRRRHCLGSLGLCPLGRDRCCRRRADSETAVMHEEGPHFYGHRQSLPTARRIVNLSPLAATTTTHRAPSGQVVPAPDSSGHSDRVVS